MHDKHAQSVVGPELGVTEAVACLRRRWAFILGCAIVAAFITGVATIALIPRHYTASTTLISSTPAAGGVGLAMAQEMLGPLAEQVAAPRFDAILYARTLANSRLVRGKIVEELDLQTRFGVDTDWEAREALGQRTRLEDDIRHRTMKISVNLKGTPWIADRSPVPDQQVRQLAADIANAYRDHLREESTRMFRADVRTRRDFVAQRLKDAQEALMGAEDRLRQWQEINEVVAPEATATEMTKLMIDLRVQQEQVKVQAASAAGQLGVAQEQLRRTDELRLATAIDIRDPRIETLQQKLSEAQTALALAIHGEGASESHPDVRRHRISIEKLTEELQEALEEELITQQRTVSASPVHDEVSKQLLSAKLQKISADAQSAALNTAVRRVTEDISRIPHEQTEFVRKVRDVKVKEQVYQMLRMEYENALVDEHRVIDNVVVLDEAIPPERKSGPAIITSAAAAGIAGLILGALWVLAAFALGTERKQ